MNYSREEPDSTAVVLAADDLEHRTKRRRIMAAVGIAGLLSVVSTAVLAGYAVRDLTHEVRLWDPLGDYPLQQADEQVVVPAGGGVAFVRVFAVKCAKETVPVAGKLGWRSLDPKGSFVDVTSDSGSTRRAGCAEFSFNNPVPAEVVAITRAHGGRMVWQIHGKEWPVRDGVLGEPREFETTPITVITI